MTTLRYDKNRYILSADSIALNELQSLLAYIASWGQATTEGNRKTDDEFEHHCEQIQDYAKHNHLVHRDDKVRKYRKTELVEYSRIPDFARGVDGSFDAIFFGGFFALHLKFKRKTALRKVYAGQIHLLYTAHPFDIKNLETLRDYLSERKIKIVEAK